MQAPLNHDASMLQTNRILRKRIGISAGMLAWAVAAGLVVSSGAVGQVLPQDIVPPDELEIRAGDLIDLATSLADAVRELKTAQLSERTLQRLQPSAAITGLETQIAQLNIQAAEGKVRVLRAIAEAQLAAAQARLEFLRRLSANQNGAQAANVQTNPRIKQAEATVRILQMILAIAPEPTRQHGG